MNELFGNALEKDEFEKVGEYHHLQDGWTNRLIQGGYKQMIIETNDNNPLPIMPPKGPQVGSDKR